MRWIATLSVCLLFGLTVPAVAQDSGRPVIDPATIFAPSVEVVETLPVLNYDNDARLVWYFNPQSKQWRSYEYPAELSNIDRPFDRSDGSYFLVDVPSSFEWQTYQLSDVDDIHYLWLFNPVSGTFDHPVARCGRPQALSGEGDWLLVQDDGLWRFCNTETGEVKNPLPEDLQQKIECVPEFYGSASATSPSGKWLVFHDCGYPVTLYSFEIATENVNRLNVTPIEFHGQLGLQHWFSETAVDVVAFQTMAKLPSPVYVVDVTKPDSLELIAYNPKFLNDPPRLVWHEVNNEPINSEDEFGAWIEVYEYNVVTGKRSHLMRYGCGDNLADCPVGPNILSPNGKLIAIENNPLDVVGAGLIIYDTVAEKVIFNEPTLQMWDEARWTDDNTFVYISDPLFAPSLSVIHFEDEKISQTSFGDSEMDLRFLSPDGTYYLANTRNAVNLYSVKTGKIIPVAASKEYLFSYWDDAGFLIVTVDYQQSWRVRVPDESAVS
jgi:hypothetical protein